MADKDSIEPLINDDSNEISPPMDSAMKLCYIIEENVPFEGLVTTTDELATATAKSWINVKRVATGEIREVEGYKVKLLRSKELLDGKLDVDNIIDEILQQTNIEPLCLAIRQQALSIDTIIPSLDDTIIHYTARKGSVECLRYMVESAGTCLPFELRNQKEFNILHSVVQNGTKEYVQLILDLAVQKMGSETPKLDEFLNAKTTDGNTALHLCIIHKKRDPIRPLLRAGVKLKLGDARNNTLLHLAAERDDTETIKRIANYHVSDAENKSIALGNLRECMLLQNDNKKIPVLLTTEKEVVDLILKYSQLDAVVDKEVGSLIHKAAAENNQLLAQALVEKNVELQVVNSKGFSPLKIASKRGNVDVVRVLLNGGADPNYIGRKVPGFSALNNAVQFGQLGCAKLLIEFGANLVHRDMTNTALHSASYGGHPDVVEFLIREVGMDVNQRNNANRTPLFQSITQGHYPVAKVLLGLGADPNVILNDDETLVHIAVREGAKEILTMLLEAKARPDEPLKNGITPLMLAVQNDRDDYIPLIMAHGITLAKKDSEGDTVMHHIARNDSCASAKYLLKRIGAMKGITQEFQLFRNKNEAGKTPYDLAIECQSENVLNIFIRHAPKNYFKDFPEHVHRFYDQKLYDTLKKVIAGLVKVDSENDVISADMMIFQSTVDSKSPNEQGLYPNKLTLLHKLMKCTDPELKYSPLVNFIVDDKLRFYRWWHLLSLISFLFFLLCLGYALVQATTKCDSMLFSYDTTEDGLRAFCEVICLVYGFVFLSVKIADFLSEWNFVNCMKKEKKCTNNVIKYYVNGKQDNIFSKVSSRIQTELCTLDKKLKFYFTAVYEYHKAQFVLIETIAAISFAFYVILRILSSPAQWTVAGITFIFFSISLLKYTRICPKLGSYVNNIIKVISTEVPSFLLVVLVLLFAFFGGIQLAARQQPISPQLTQNLTGNGTMNFPYPVCNNSKTAFFWFNPSLTAIYDLRRPLLTGLVLLLDGGASLHEEDILQDNFFFILVYLAFAFILIVLMLNILIAQFIYTYRQVVSSNSSDYKYELLFDLELKNFFLFWKYFKKSSSIERIEMPLSMWNELCEAPARPIIDQAILDMNKDFSRKGMLIEQEFEKNSKSHSNLRGNVSELSREVNIRLAEFGESLNELKKMKDSIENIKELKESINQIKILLQNKEN